MAYVYSSLAASYTISDFVFSPPVALSFSAMKNEFMHLSSVAILDKEIVQERGALHSSNLCAHLVHKVTFRCPEKHYAQLQYNVYFI